MINLGDLRKKSLATLLLVFMASAMLPACSSDEEEAEDCENASTADEKEACVQDLPV